MKYHNRSSIRWCTYLLIVHYTLRNEIYTEGNDEEEEVGGYSIIISKEVILEIKVRNIRPILVEN
jgi:hypothetical protein